MFINSFGESQLGLQGLAVGTSPQGLLDNFNTPQQMFSTLRAGLNSSTQRTLTVGVPEGPHMVAGNQMPLVPEHTAEKGEVVGGPTPDASIVNLQSTSVITAPEDLLDPVSTTESAVVAGAINAAPFLGGIADAGATAVGAISTYEYVKTALPPGPRGKAVAVAAGTSVLLANPAVRSSVERNVEFLATTAFRPLNEEPNRPPSPKEDFSGDVSLQATPQPTSNKLSLQSDNQMPENPFAPSSIVEASLSNSLDFLFFLACSGLVCVLFITFFILITESRTVRTGGFVGRLKSALQRSSFLRAFKLLFLFIVMSFLFILKSASYLPLYSDPAICRIIQYASNFAISLSFYTYGGEVVITLENLLSKKNFKGRNAFLQFLHNLNKNFFYSVYIFYAKLICSFYLIIAFMLFIYLLY